jgi:ferredoxin-NADP reductase
MTSLNLLLWIALGILSQLAIYLGFSFWRHWQDYRALRTSAEELNLPVKEDVPEEVEGASVAAWTGFRNFRVERKVFEDDAQSICSFYLCPEDAQALPSFLPGQFLTFRLDAPMTAIGTEQIVRCYSLSDAPRPDYYRISIKRIPPPPGGGVPPGRSSNYFHDHVEVGSLLYVRAPAGHFHIDRSDAPVVLIAGGIGITPMLSMVNWCLAEQPGREVWLFYGVRNSREMVMKSHLESLVTLHPNFRLRVCFSNPLPDDVAVRDYQHPVRVDVNVLKMQLPLKPYHFYLCGPTSMMGSLVPALEDWGVPDARIHFEAFGPASIKRRTAVNSSVPVEANETDIADIIVSFVRSGKQLCWQPTGGSLLEFAETNGIAVNSGCRAGGCGTCQTTIQSGEVAYRQSPDFDPEPGTCLLCVSIPKTSVTLEA